MLIKIIEISKSAPPRLCLSYFGHTVGSLSLLFKPAVKEKRSKTILVANMIDT